MPEPRSRGSNSRFFSGAQGWPYLLVPFIPLAIALDLLNASATADLRHGGPRDHSRRLR